MDSLNDYLTNLASEEPAPGGGSGAMVVGAAACSLVAMVARICAGSKRYAALHDRANRLVAEADALRERMLRLRAEDEAAFGAVVAARGDREAMERALHGAAAAPLSGAQAALEALQLTERAEALGNKNLVSDIGCAAEFAHAALNACAYNVRINHKFMKDEAAVSAQRAELERVEREAAALTSTLRKAVGAALAS